MHCWVSRAWEPISVIVFTGFQSMDEKHQLHAFWSISKQLNIDTRIFLADKSASRLSKTEFWRTPEIDFQKPVIISTVETQLESNNKYPKKSVMVGRVTQISGYNLFARYYHSCRDIIWCRFKINAQDSESVLGHRLLEVLLLCALITRIENIFKIRTNKRVNYFNHGFEGCLYKTFLHQFSIVPRKIW